MSNGASIAAYGSYRLGQNSFLDGLIGHGRLDMDSTRYVSGFGDFAKANRGGSQLFASITASYEFREKNSLLSPYGRYDYAIDRLDATTESGAGLGALHYSSQQYKSQQISLGLRGEMRDETNFGVAMPSARLEYQRHIESANQASVAYADLLGTTYNLTTPTGNSNAWMLGVGSGFALRNGFDVDLSMQWMRSSGGQETNRSLFVRISKPLGK